jgi:putative peptidoglycan lipid II flippase
MIKTWLKPIGVGKATALISIASFLSYAIGLLRDRIIAVHFGTTSATDAYNASFLIPDFLFNLFIAGALAAAFLPVFSEYLVKDKEEAHKIADTILTGGTLLIGFLALVAFIFMDKLTPFLFSDIDPSMRQDITNMTRLMLSSAILFSISNTLGNILMAYKQFMSYALSPILYNLGIILGVVFLNERFGIYSAAIGVVIGGILHCGIRFLDLSTSEYKFHFRADYKSPGFKKIIKLMIPQSISLVAQQISLYVFAIVGMNILAGGLAAFNFARNIKSFPISLFGIAFATAVFPYLTNAISTNNHKEYVHHIQKTIQRILFFTIPSMIGMMLLATPIVALILSGGIFKEKSIELTSLLLFFFALSIPFESIIHILSRSFYALQNTVTPMIINICTTILIAVFTWIVAPIWGIQWFAIIWSIGFVLQVIVLLIFLRKELAGFGFKEFFISFAKTILATGLMAAAIILSQSLEGIIAVKLSYVVRIFFGAGVFFLAAHLIKSPELSSIKYIIARLFKKPAKINID